MTSATMTAFAQATEFRAAGTDLSERRRSGVSKGPLIDIAATADTSGSCGAPTARRGSAPSRRSPRSRADAPHRASLSGSCGGSAWSRDAAGPSSRDARRQSRAALALLVFSQSAYRLPEERRQRIVRLASGNHLYGVAFDLGPCVAPHPSTMAAALLAYEAKHRHRSAARALDRRDLLGDGTSAADHRAGSRAK